ncbi:RagB/SusD family nutrient uptake outer membrane protein [Aestuariibaculum sp. M13]|uniref:RagB/SusD family nutrient uptake outer membrane protein n=1 Tax=Aestuariibaculum sp. M13 TaxID=2967132 RepID=UPI00215A0772|nr:RagB/SusD family nutrient uptake outer membrane protein [Aestuariibaculum sp. M13]MCR8668735.1 RagB/SusD family nutrient uptake outer membrane protein [Aestuariibaculum sp. M13]
MKTYINKLKSLVLASVVVTLSSCSIEDIKPINQLTQENTIRDEESARQVLNGVYDLGREFDLSSFPLYLAGYGNEGLITGNLTGGTGYNTNQVPVDNQVLANLYNAHYKIINLCNFLIEGLEAGDAQGISDIRKAEMLSEARFQRAFAYFNLLRYFGQFYDTNSIYGVVLRNNFSTELVAASRNTVQEVYEFIHDDLEFAVANGPQFIEHFYTGKLAAQALLAKVELYMGNYGQAAILANDVINNTEGYALETQYADIFANSFNSVEVIFAPVTGSGQEGGTNMNLVNRTSYSENLRSSADAQVGADNDGDLTGAGANYDPRFSFAYAEANQGPNMQGKYPFLVSTASQSNTMYHLRLAEIYLVHAEAEARRTGGDLNEALKSLNTIRNRATVTPKTLSDRPTLLEDIRQEKLLELFFENGEPWFDLVRYDVLGNIDASNIKTSIISEKQFVLPIPSQVIIGNKNVIQNPDY